MAFAIKKDGKTQKENSQWVIQEGKQGCYLFDRENARGSGLAHIRLQFHTPRFCSTSYSG